MASQRPSRNFDETTLQALEHALRDVWQVLKAHDPYHNWDKDLEFQQGLAATLMDLADAGVTDRQELRKKGAGILRFEAVALGVWQVQSW